MVLKLLEKDPVERYSIASDVAKALRDIRVTLTGPEGDTSVEETPAVMPMRLFEVPLIGRDESWQRAQRALNDLPYGGKLLKIGAASGLGLSRFLREVRREARGHDYAVLQVSYHDGVGMPYQAWRDGLSEFAERYPDALEAARQGLEPALSLLFPELSLDNPPADVPADIAQVRLYDAVDKLLTRLTDHKPLVVIVDNAHFADEGSLGLMAYLARGLESNPLFLAYGYHEPQLGKPARKTLSGLEGLELPLEPLSDDATRDLLAALLGDELEPRLERYLLERVAGNPFFAEEVLLAMLRNGSLTRQAGVWEWQGEATIAATATTIPQRIEDVFVQRLERLSDSAQKALRVASAVGRNFYFETLQQLLDVDEDTLLDDLDELLRADLVEERSADLYRFSHLLLRETLHDSLSARRRRRYHQKIADMLRSRPDLPPGELAEHYAETANPERAAPFALRAARNAEEIYTNDVAERFYRLYLAVAPEDAAERPQAQLELATVLERIGVWDEAEELLHDLSPDPDYQVEALSRLGLLMQKQGELAQSETYLREAIATEPNSPKLYSQLGRTLAQKGELKEAREVLNLALVFATQMAEPERGSGAIADVYIELAELEDHADQYKKAIDLLAKAQEHVSDERKIAKARIFHLLGNAHLKLGQFELATENSESAQKLYQEVGDVERAISIKQNIANIFANTGNKTKAIKMSKEVQSQARRLGNKKLEAIAAVNQGIELYNLGMYREAVDPLENARNIFRNIEMRLLEMHACLELAGSYIQIQSFTDAQKMLDAVEKQLQETPQKFYEATWTYHQGELFLHLGQPQEAQDILSKSMQAFIELETLDEMLRNRQALAMACLLLDDSERCEEQLNAAGKLSKDLGKVNEGLVIAYIRALLSEDPSATNELRHDLTDVGLEHIVAKFDAILVANDRTPPN
ncbi:MAG: AAA family ATPase [Trueperaceae bacterium]|nr:AAA family ATPase [Trueperaceae bacterium]